MCLVVGGLRLANTTLMSVMERQPEIGLRRALGARRRHVAGQFLSERCILGAVGGLVGTALGAASLIGRLGPARLPWAGAETRRSDH